MKQLEKYRNEILKSRTEIVEERKKDKIDDNENILTEQYLKLLSESWKEIK